MGRYSFIAEDKDKKVKRIIKVKEFDERTGIDKYKSKVDLASIDKYTLYFESKEQLVQYLKTKGIIDNTKTDLYIEYQSSGTKRLPIVYKDMEELKHFSLSAKSVVNEVDYEFQKTVDRLLKNCRQDGYFKFLVEKKYLNKYLEEHIAEYLEKEDTEPRGNLIFLRRKITTNMTGYKIIRGILVGSKQYYEYINNPFKENYIEEVEDNNDYSTIIDTYITGGYEELFNHYDLEQLCSLPTSVQKRLGLKF